MTQRERLRASSALILALPRPILARRSSFRFGRPPKRPIQSTGAPLIARYAARYFWPAVVDDRLEVIAVSNEGNEISAADTGLVHYEPFIQLYQRVKNGVRGPNDVPARTSISQFRKGHRREQKGRRKPTRELR